MFLVRENIMIAHLGSKSPPVEGQHKSNGVVNSFFLTGVLDFLCCSSNIDKFSFPTKRMAFEDWENSCMFELIYAQILNDDLHSSLAVVPPGAMWKSLNEFLLYLKERAWAFDQ
jgi:hypothetical protein